MIYIVVALKSEAQAFVDYYKLQKSKLGAYTFFSHKSFKLIVSGIGVQNARVATQTLINNFDISDEDTYYNIGICGASKNYALGSLLQVGAIEHQEITYNFNTKHKKIVCVDEEISDNSFDIVDMESYGFYDAVVHNPAIQNFYIYKIVSDHFQPQTITKEKTKALVFHTIEDIF